MIKKLKPIKAFDCSDTPQAKTQHHSYHNDCIKKINELVDAVNKLQKNATISKMENVDPYAEQRKWIGKLCRFWDIDNYNLYYGPLTKIHDTGPYYYECNNRICYANCEPVSEDLIYKGGDNE